MPTPYAGVVAGTIPVTTLILRFCEATQQQALGFEEDVPGVCYTLFRGRYCIASAMCVASMRSAPARSAIVRASFSTR